MQGYLVTCHDALMFSSSVCLISAVNTVAQQGIVPDSIHIQRISRDYNCVLVCVGEENEKVISCQWPVRGDLITST